MVATFRLVRTRNHIKKKQIKYTTTKWKLNIKTQYLLLQLFLVIPYDLNTVTKFLLLLLLLLLFCCHCCTPCEIFTSALADGLSQKSELQNSWTLFSIQADLRKIIIKMASIRLLISNPPDSFSKPFRTVLYVHKMIGITDTLMFHNFLSSVAWSKVLSLFLLSHIFTLGLQNPLYGKFSFLLTITRCCNL